MTQNHFQTYPHDCAQYACVWDLALFTQFSWFTRYLRTGLQTRNVQRMAYNKCCTQQLTGACMARTKINNKLVGFDLELNNKQSSTANSIEISQGISVQVRKQVYLILKTYVWKITSCKLKEHGKVKYLNLLTFENNYRPTR